LYDTSYSVMEKTYTFRASDDLGPRAREALSTLRSLFEKSEGDEGLDQAVSAFLLALARRAPDFRPEANQSVAFRTALEVFIDAAEKLARDREHLGAYEEWAAEDDEARAVRAAALKGAASRWDE
jgi:hypothetical protein